MIGSCSHLDLTQRMQISLFTDQPDYAPAALLDYRAIPRVSNSDLTRLKEEALGYWSVPDLTNAARLGTERTRVFGKAFHQHLLEPESIGSVISQFLPDLTANESTRLSSLMHVLRQDAFCRRYLTPTSYRRVERERVVLFDDPLTGLACKSRLDVVYTSPKRQNALVLDFKTTAARTQAQFLQTCYDYDYDRQAAFYVDSLRHSETGEWDDTRQFRFVFVGVTKQSPHRLFVVDATSLPDFVEYGRKKYRFWLRKWRESDAFGSEPRLALPLSA
jgi:hypothetical protein